MQYMYIFISLLFTYKKNVHIFSRAGFLNITDDVYLFSEFHVYLNYSNSHTFTMQSISLCFITKRRFKKNLTKFHQYKNIRLAFEFEVIIVTCKYTPFTNSTRFKHSKMMMQ